MRAIIVGGGIVGLASALALTRRGWQVEVLERAGPSKTLSPDMSSIRQDTIATSPGAEPSPASIKTRRPLRPRPLRQEPLTGETMQTQETSLAKLTTVAIFPQYYFLENLVVREDGSILVTAALQKELWYVPPADAAAPARPVLVHTFDQLASGIVETEPDVFCITSSDGYTTHESFLHRLDLRQWSPGEPVRPECVLQFADPVGGLNGSCLLAPGVIVLADSVAGLIWRVDLPAGDGQATARVWLKHDSMACDPDSPLVPPQPGVNGVRYAWRAGYLYYTSTAQKLFMRVPVDPQTHDPVRAPEFVAGGIMADDFCIDEDAGVAYVTTHRQNTIDRVPLEPGGSGARQIVAGDPFDEQLVGPSSAAWGRRPGDYGRIAYLTTDGGLVAPPTDDIVRPAKLLRADLLAALRGPEQTMIGANINQNQIPVRKSQASPRASAWPRHRKSSSDDANGDPPVTAGDRLATTGRVNRPPERAGDAP
jgi:hypothetical protein